MLNTGNITRQENHMHLRAQSSVLHLSSIFCSLSGLRSIQFTPLSLAFLSQSIKMNYGPEMVYGLNDLICGKQPRKVMHLKPVVPKVLGPRRQLTLFLFMPAYSSTEVSKVRDRNDDLIAIHILWAYNELPLDVEFNLPLV